MSADESSQSSLAELAALEQLLAEHRPRLLAMVQRRLDPSLAVRVDADDVLAEAYLQARRRWAQFRAGSPMSPYAWLYRIALDCLIEAWRHHARGPRNVRCTEPWPEQSSLQLGLNLVGTGTSPSEAAARAEECRRVRQAVDLLKPRDRNVLWMRHHDGLSFAEVGEVLEVSENTAAVRYARALKRLRDLWRRLHEGG